MPSEVLAEVLTEVIAKKTEAGSSSVQALQKLKDSRRDFYDVESLVAGIKQELGSGAEFGNVRQLVTDCAQRHAGELKLSAFVSPNTHQTQTSSFVPPPITVVECGTTRSCPRCGRAVQSLFDHLQDCEAL